MALIETQLRTAPAIYRPPAKNGAPLLAKPPAAEVQTVQLSRGSIESRPVTYHKYAVNIAAEQPEPQRASDGSGITYAVRELTALAAHPKMLLASKTFLDIAHYDSGTHLVDVYA